MTRIRFVESALIVEDVPLIANAICRELRLLGAFGQVRIANSVVTAIEATREMANLRLVTVDVKLHDDDDGGFRVLETIRRHRPEPLAAVITGASDPTVRKRAAELGAPTLPKPYPSSAMKRLVDQALAWPIRGRTTAKIVTARSREWGLTRAEHRVLCWKVAGRDAETYSAESGMAISTFGYYLKEISRKAGRQGGWADLESALLRESLAVADA